MDRFKNRLEQIPECIQQRRNEIVDRLPNIRNDRPDRIQHSADRCMDRIPYGCDDRFYQVDFCGHIIVDCCPDADKKVFDSCPDRSEECCNAVQNTRNKACDIVPEIDEKGLDCRPDIYPELFHFVKACAENITQHVHIILQRVFQEIPHRYKNTLDSVPGLVPVAGEDANENVEYIQNSVCHKLEDVSDLLKNALKDRCKEFTESVPYRLDDLTDILEVKAECVHPVNDALTEALKNALDLISDRCDLVAEVLICFPEMHKSRNQSGDNRNDSYHRCGNAPDSSTE